MRSTPGDSSRRPRAEPRALRPSGPEAETFGQWRTRIRLAASLSLLAAGMPIARIAGRVGHATPSAYVAAFRRDVGVPPGRYFAG
ncbi:helix-turn-helix domain-containing protein [Nocardia araoensis]|uniref:helix-turn-helix domain-containing protein n=1 Tax=Nocardia araoensis TaxID=228600 RepID=UPI00031C4AD9|nr:helix-turn-helix domain-containing protein [Nocardia araoensis]